VAGPCKDDNEPSSFIKGAEFVGQLRKDYTASIYVRAYVFLSVSIFELFVYSTDFTVTVHFMIQFNRRL
jgi:hypothetical protein